MTSTDNILFSDKAGNNERLAFVYDSNKITMLEKVGEVAVEPKSQKDIKLSITKQKFKGFDRNPYLAAFQTGNLRFLLVTVHLYAGTPMDSKRSVNRRALEAYALARWADLRRKSKNKYVDDIIVLGDFNIPKVKQGDVIYDALTKRGLKVPEHSNKVWSNLKNDKQYDQIAFFPSQTSNKFTGNFGVFDFDSALFQYLFKRLRKDNKRTYKQKFLSYLRYYISDHRIMWVEFKV